jgi:hypothetical protein
MVYQQMTKHIQRQVLHMPHAIDTVRDAQHAISIINTNHKIRKFRHITRQE